MFNQSAANYANLQPVTAGEPGSTTTTAPGGTTVPGTATTAPGGTTAPAAGDGDGGTNWALFGGIAAVVVALAAFFVSRRKSEDERE